MMTFEEAMKTVCLKCGTQAQVHRLTRTGNLYCLVWNAAAQRERRWFAQRLPDEVYTTPIKHLVRSPLGKDVGAVIDYELHSAANAGIPF